MSHRDTIEIGTVLDDRYVVDDRIGAGGYGEVLAAHDRVEQRTVALKVLHRRAFERDPQAVARLRQEAEILRAVQHPNIVRVFDTGECPEGYFLVMELIEGQGMDSLIEDDAPLDTPRLLKLVQQLLNALKAAHGHQILHRDLKPANILVTGPPGDETIKLVDFGVAKAAELLNTDDSDEGITLVKTRAGDFVGTPRYSSPEAVVGDPLQPASDLFCVGLVVYEALVGTPLIVGKTPSELINELIFPRPFDLDELPQQWQTWLGPLLEKSPQRRIASAEEALQSLAEIFPSFDQSTSPVRQAPKNLPSADQTEEVDELSLYPAFGDEELDLDEEETREYDALQRAAVGDVVAEVYGPTVERPPPDMPEFDAHGPEHSAPVSFEQPVSLRDTSRPQPTPVASNEQQAETPSPAPVFALAVFLALLLIVIVVLLVFIAI